MIKNKIKPCPFCGAKAKMYYNYSNFALIQCTKCGISTLYKPSEEEVIKDWNTRKPIDKVVQQLEEEMFIDKNGNNVLQGGTIDYEQRYKYEIGCNYGLTKAIKIVKDG